jgi:hypothetical protein
MAGNFRTSYKLVMNNYKNEIKLVKETHYQ